MAGTWIDIGGGMTGYLAIPSRRVGTWRNRLCRKYSA